MASREADARRGSALSAKAAPLRTAGNAMTVHASPRPPRQAGRRRKPGPRPQPADARHREHALWRLPAFGRAGRARAFRASQTARASLAAKRVSIAYDARPRRRGRRHRRAAERAGFAAAAIEAAKQDRDDARQNYLLRRVAVAGFAAMNIMLHLDRGLVGRGERHGPAAGERFPLAVGADRAAHGRLCGAAVSSSRRSAR